MKEELKSTRNLEYFVDDVTAYSVGFDGQLKTIQSLV